MIGARNFLIAYNINLNTTSTRRANALAFDLREAGRPKREGNPITGTYHFLVLVIINFFMSIFFSFPRCYCKR